jgi:hypothetical protein
MVKPWGEDEKASKGEQARRPAKIIGFESFRVIKACRHW